eukprot:ctg_1307.g428
MVGAIDEAVKNANKLAQESAAARLQLFGRSLGEQQAEAFLGGEALAGEAVVRAKARWMRRDSRFMTRGTRFLKRVPVLLVPGAPHQVHGPEVPWIEQAGAVFPRGVYREQEAR